MKATVGELKRNADKIIAAIERHETVTLSKRGKEIAQIVPTGLAPAKTSIRDNPAIGMWSDREDMKDPVEYVRKLRRGRYRDL